ncbi:DUF916 domain-containing protein [Streptomyces sp. NPDC048659]|uniref:WxL protein peptidoglycan domain-containing protein n=1 Tax=Streptomyces sp. NPDC048659 TaxID=3155489 RepID=UPI00342F41F8
MTTLPARRLAAALAACLLAALPAAPAAAARPAAPAATAPASAPAPPAAPGDGTPAKLTGRTTFGVQPATAKKPDARPHFSYGATPGAVVEDHLAVFNYGTAPLTLRVYAQDAFTTADGGFDLYAAARRPTGVGAWVRLRTDRVTVPARSHTLVPFTLTVPPGATPGDHTGGVVASLSALGTGREGSKVAVDQRVGARIYVRVAGELAPRLAVEDLTTGYHGTPNPFGTGEATVTYTLRNTGNVRLAARQSVEVRDPLGGTADVPKLRDVPELLPGDSLKVTTTATGVLPAFSGTTTVTVDPAPVRGDVRHRILPRVTRTAGFTAVPWASLALLLLLAAGTAALAVRRRRRARAARDEPARTPPRPRRTAVATAAVLLAAATAATATPAAPARAAEAAPAPAAAGALAVLPPSGADTQPITLVTDAPCPARTTHVIARVFGAGFARDGQIVVGNAPVGTYARVPGGGLSVPLLATLRDYAATAGFTTLRGGYAFTVSCLQGAFQAAGLREFTGTLRFTATSSYRDGSTIRTPTGPAVAPVPAATGTVPAPTPRPAAAPAAPAAPASDGALTAWSAAGFGVALLALLAGATLWRRGRRRRPAADAPAAT